MKTPLSSTPIARDPMPGLHIARCCRAHHLEALDTLGWALAVDARASVRQLVHAGADPDRAARVVRDWMVDRLAAAIDTGIAVAVLEPADCHTCQAVVEHGRCWGCGVAA